MKYLFLITSLIFFLNSFACTTFVLKTKNDLVFGRNLDWVSEEGLIVVNKRNVKKTSLVFPPEKPIEWISKYGSISFNQFGAEFPYGGINEEGLVVEIMTSRAEYPLPDNRPAINESQWVQYQLDNAKNIEEVISSNKDIRISKIQQNLHFLITDKKGNSAVIEFLNRKMKVYKGENLPFAVLENSTYDISLYNQKAKKQCRFNTTLNMLNNYKLNDTNISPVDYSFKILEEVALDGSWSIVYDIKNMQIHFNTASNRNVQIINFNEFDYDCSTPKMLYNINNNKQGNISKLFTPFNKKVNTLILQTAIKTNKVHFPEVILKKFYNYHESCVCKN